MITMIWKKVEGTQNEKPKSLDTISSPNTVYIRRKIERATRSDNDSNDIEVWKYEECEIDRNDYDKEPYAINEMAQMIEQYESYEAMNKTINDKLEELSKVIKK